MARRYRSDRRESLPVRELPPEEQAPILRQYVREVKVTRPYFDAQPDDDVAAKRYRRLRRLQRDRELVRARHPLQHELAN